MGKKAITIKFDTDVYNDIKSAAENFERSFGGQVNYLVKCWLQIYKSTGMTAPEVLRSLNKIKK